MLSKVEGRIRKVDVKEHVRTGDQGGTEGVGCNPVVEYGAEV